MFISMFLDNKDKKCKLYVKKSDIYDKDNH